MPLIFGVQRLGRPLMIKIPKPGDLPVLTTLLLPTKDREVLRTAVVSHNKTMGIFTFFLIKGNDVFFALHTMF
ncbi:hypothetical protein SAMN03159341_109238 [Paenibacillus sp. 1_12]|nr:hypothetical protein SAMN03159341_109238 [Paenibacillus sp. 1_12]